MILSANSIRRLRLVYPCVERGVIRGRSFGLSVAGYDLRVKETFFLEPGEFRLCSSIERLNLPKNIMGLTKNKSSWARRGLDASFSTVIDPGFEGYLTIEIVNHGYERLRVTEGDPILQLIFQYTEDDCEPYSGKYQRQQSGPQEARYEV